MSSAAASSSSESATEPSPSTSSNRLSSLDPSKKYTLVFLISVGTTLLLTGASGGRLLKRAKRVTAEPVPASAPHQPPAKPAPAAEPIPVPRAPLSPFNPPTLDSYALSADPSSLRPRQRSLLRSFRLPVDSPTAAAGRPQTAYFLPNATLLSRSTAFAEALDKQDRLHKDGEEQPEAPDDGFNPAVYAAKAFGIATALTVGTFAAGVWGVMKWLEVDDVSTTVLRRGLMKAGGGWNGLGEDRQTDAKVQEERRAARRWGNAWQDLVQPSQLESLSLALSHRLPSNLPRPSLPSWALPSPSSPSDIHTPGAEEDSVEHKEGVAYWVSVKETLDREAEERVEERRRRWEEVVRAREGRQV